jgi:hypothetical protein
LEYLIAQYFSVNSHFIDNNRSYKGEFFTIDTIDDGLSFDAIKSILSLDHIYLVLYTIFGKDVSADKASWLNQRTRPAREQFHLKEHIKLHRMAFSKVCGNELVQENFLNKIQKTKGSYRIWQLC